MEYTGLIAGIVVGAVVACVATWTILRRQLGGLTSQLAERDSRIRDLEEQVYVEARNGLEERNRAIEENAGAIHQARAAGFEEGREYGRGELQRDHLEELTSQRRELTRMHDDEVKRVTQEALETQRAQFELQTKLFAVSVTPYVHVSTKGGLVRKKYTSVKGYQYQLLVNGIPAFTPTVVAQDTEEIDVYDEATRQALIAGATDLAKTAIKSYLGGASQFAQLAPAAVTAPAVVKSKAGSRSDRRPTMTSS